LISPLALILGLAIAGGGFVVGQRHIAGLAVWLLLVGMLALGAAGRATLGRSFYWTTGLIAGLALFSAFSSLWSGSIELSVTETDRVLVYLGFFLAAFLIAQTDQRRQRFAEGIGISLIAIAIIALASRLLPDLLGPGLGSNARLGYPLGYWNANGLAFGIGAALALWMSRRSLNAPLRWFAVGALPTLLLALYLTYSRGGLLALVVACGCLIALSHDRLWLLATLAVAALATLPAVLAVQARRGVADNIAMPGATDQGVTVLLILLAGTAVTLGLYALLRRLERNRNELTGRALAVSRNPAVLKWVAIVLALVAVGAAVAVGSRSWDDFSNSELALTQPEDRFESLSGTGRSEFWRVALDALGEDPLLGQGAGTYRFAWFQEREIETAVLDAHSLYFEAFAELGLIGGLLVLGLVGTLLWTGFAAWREASGPRRELYAVLLAACLAFAVVAGLDWLWEIAAVGAIFFAAAGVLVAARCGQLARTRAESNGRDEGRRFGLTVAGLAVAWISALALVGPLLVDREIDASNAAAADGDLAGAVERADNARSIEPWAASPYVQLGLLAELQGDYATASERLGQAIEREEDNWQLYYLRARTESKAGDEAAAQADLEAAQRLNPEEKCLQEGFEGCG
jgi:tetratricopeptide (TPR) repeat protein